VPAERALAGPITLSEGFADHGHERFLSGVGFADVASGTPGDSQSGEEPRRDESDAGRVVFGSVQRFAIDVHGPDSACHRHGEKTDIGSIGDARQRLHLRQYPPVECGAPGGGQVLRHRKRSLKRQDTVASESRVNRLDSQQCPQQQTGRNQQNYRQRNFREDERGTEPGLAHASRSRSLAQSGKIAAARSLRWYGPESNAGQSRENRGEAQHAKINGWQAGGRQGRNQLAQQGQRQTGQ
jgi:hypothetical protein